MGAHCTLKDIAKELGIGVSTVSRVLNNAPSAKIVSEATRKRIEEAVERRDYVPDESARRLARRRSDVVCFVAPERAGLDGSPSLAEALRGFEETLRAAGCKTMLAFNRGELSSGEEVERLFKAKSVDGIAVWNAKESESFWDKTSSRNLVMLNSCDASGADRNYIGIDNFAGADEVSMRLLEAGRKRIAYLDGDKGTSCSRERLAGCRQSLEDAGFRLEEGRVFRAETRRRALELLLEAVKDPEKPPFDAVQCFDDALAKDCALALSARGLKIPEDVMLGGGDFDSEGAPPPFPVPSFRANFRVMGELAASWLLEGGKGRRPGYRRLILPALSV